jgi:hypothetical protein
VPCCLLAARSGPRFVPGFLVQPASCKPLLCLRSCLRSSNELRPESRGGGRRAPMMPMSVEAPGDVDA